MEITPLNAVALCFTSGPLAGRAMRLRRRPEIMERVAHGNPMEMRGGLRRAEC
jgi:hypothetical protein